MEVVLTEDAEELHAALYNTFWCIAITVTNTVREATVVDTNTYSGVVLFTYINEGNQPIFYFLQFLRILLIGVLQFLKRSSRVDIVAWIDANLLCIECSNVCYVCIKMDISTERSRIAISTQSCIDIL